MRLPRKTHRERISTSLPPKTAALTAWRIPYLSRTLWRWACETALGFPPIASLRVSTVVNVELVSILPQLYIMSTLQNGTLSPRRETPFTNLLQPARLLERVGCGEKIGPGSQGFRRCCEKMADEADLWQVYLPALSTFDI